jgi:hypothetical protein
MISIALTKKVPTKGRIIVKYSKCDEIAQIKHAQEIKKRTQNIPVFFFFCSMNSVFEKLFLRK